jgi:hypothetical protein
MSAGFTAIWFAYNTGCSTFHHSNKEIMMKRIACTLGFALLAFLAVPGCGSSEPTNIATDADQSEIEKYEAQIAAEEAAASGMDVNE